MKKTLLLHLSLILSLGISLGQNIYKATSGEISFFSEAPMENIEAHNTQIKALINTEKKEVAFIVPIIGFKFKKALMEEHFNENYMESDKYKTAQYTGNIEGDVNFKKDGTYPVTGKGKLTIHGVEQKREFVGEIKVEGDKVILSCNFKVKLEDHNIEIPKMVIKNIAEEVDVKVITTFESKPSK